MDVFLLERTLCELTACLFPDGGRAGLFVLFEVGLTKLLGSGQFYRYDDVQAVVSSTSDAVTLLPGFRA